ncbi:endonuclease domain-containing protein [Streptomyces sp. NPDC048521]|uniref:endonuclease domain-containing protein n=1 Tax=Streptomyces sp. NPDC048521 TaxID=3365566 RepID=UPI00371E465B
MCWLCRRTLPISAFRLRKSSGGAAQWRSRCNECEAADRQLQAKNALRDHTQDRASKSYAGLRRYAKKLGIPWSEVVERYPVDNRCEVCGRTPQEASRSGRFARLSLDHCHQTGQLRGFLCSPCNSGVGHLGDNPERLRGALKYLTKFESIRILGPAPEPRTADDGRHEVDQDAIPGL